jgi:hypothetical protein
VITLCLWWVQLPINSGIWWVHIHTLFQLLLLLLLLLLFPLVGVKGKADKQSSYEPWVPNMNLQFCTRGWLAGWLAGELGLLQEATTLTPAKFVRGCLVS